MEQSCINRSLNSSPSYSSSHHLLPWPVGVSGAGEAALGEGEEPAEGQHRGEQGEDAQAGELLDRGADAVPHRQRAPEGGAGAVPDAGEEVQQGQEAHQGLPAEVSPSRVPGSGPTWT